MNKTELEGRIREGIPLSMHMDFRVLSLSQNRITVFGRSEENQNVHGTAFAGSLYAIATLAAWGLVQSRLPAETELVMATGEINYLKPVVGDIVANCHIDKDAFETFLSSLKVKGKARLTAISTIPCEDGNGAEFKGLLYARLSH
ncbi:MAG: YiiD C-terminal domain-containing protein [Candidatus Thiodiazotropha sp. DIVDIV]